ncbi:MAG: hypothetical protein JNL38_13175 [Myxococcales bacterium]|nr:hypothetical protein [Myxococcales bacterium]
MTTSSPSAPLSRPHVHAAHPHAHAPRGDGGHHHHACDCAHHRAARPGARRAGALSWALPILACAVCPSCITTYAKVLSGLGLGFALTEAEHVALLVVCVAVSLGAAVRDLTRDRRAGPFAATAGGCAALVASHLAEPHAPAWLPWVGAALLLVGGAWGHWGRRLARARAGAPA